MFTALHRERSEYDTIAPFQMPTYQSVMGQFHKVRVKSGCVCCRVAGRLSCILCTDCSRGNDQDASTYESKGPVEFL